MSVNLPSDPITNKFGNVAGIINSLFPYVFVFAGLSLLVMLIIGGIVLLTSAGDPAKTKDGYGKIIGAIIGFSLVFITYFVAQIIEVVLGVKIL